MFDIPVMSSNDWEQERARRALEAQEKKEFDDACEALTQAIKAKAAVAGIQDINQLFVEPGQKKLQVFRNAFFSPGYVTYTPADEKLNLTELNIFSAELAERQGFELAYLTLRTAKDLQKSASGQTVLMTKVLERTKGLLNNSNDERYKKNFVDVQADVEKEFGFNSVLSKVLVGFGAVMAVGVVFSVIAATGGTIVPFVFLGIMFASMVGAAYMGHSAVGELETGLGNIDNCLDLLLPKKPGK